MHFGIRARLYGLIGIFAVGLIAVVCILVHLQSQMLIDRRHQELQGLVEATLGIVQAQHAQMKSGQISEAEAKSRALDIIAKQRYRGDNYFWINDLHPKMVMHPIRAELNGKDLTDYKDPTGTAIFVEFVKTVRQSGSGFVDYLWPKPGFDSPVEKTSYVTLFEPWGWVVGTGVYNDDIIADRNRTIELAAVIALLVLLLVAGISLYSVRDITRGFAALRSAMLELADGNFDVALPGLGRKDEIGDVAGAVKTTADRLSQMITDIKAASTEVSNAATEISTSTTDLSQRTEEQAASLEQTSASMEQISATVKSNAENAQRANAFAGTTREVADRGGKVVAEAIGAMSRIEDSSRKIADIIGVIDEIARQTNLLALNAAVEAARAGDAGRGFAVVASEVRSLAQRSSQAAKDIKNLIVNSTGQVQDGVDLVNRAGKSLGEIVESINSVADIVADITSASAEQSTGLDQINKALTKMDEMTQHNAALVEQNAATSKMLETQSAAMNQRVSIFRVNTAASHAAAPVISMPNASVRKRAEPSGASTTVALAARPARRSGIVRRS